MIPQKATLRQRMREAATEAMLDAAEAAMIERGYDKATMQDIAAAAGCATGTFYLYFKNKEVLLGQIMARHSSAMNQSARAELDKPAPPLERIRAGVAEFIRYAHAHRPFFRLFFTAMPMRHRAIMQKLGTDTLREHHEYNLLELDLLRQAQQLGSIRADLPAEALQNFMMDVGFGIVEQFVFDDDPPGPDELMRVIWGLITGGLGARSQT